MKLHLKRWFLKGLVFAIVSFIAMLPITIPFTILSLFLGLLAIVLLIPVVIISLIAQGAIMEWVNKAIK